MDSLEECIQNLGCSIEILAGEKADQVFSAFIKKIPLTKWGKVDWSKIEKKVKINAPEDVLFKLSILSKKLDNSVFILWNEASLPVIKANLKRTIKVIDSITRVYFETWLFSIESEYVIEFKGGDIVAGLSPKS